MDAMNNIVCPVCTLFLRPGITLENHLTSHPKQKVIEALIKLSQLGPQSLDKLVNNDEGATFSQENNNDGYQGSWTQPSAPVPFGQNQGASNVNQLVPSVAPTNHSFIYQQFMSSSGTQPALTFNPMTQQFVAVPTVFNPQMFCSPYVFQQQQQLHIVSTGTNVQPLLPKQGVDIASAVSATSVGGGASADLLDKAADKSKDNKTEVERTKEVVAVGQSYGNSAMDGPDSVEIIPLQQSTMEAIEIIPIHQKTDDVKSYVDLTQPKEQGREVEIMKITYTQSKQETLAPQDKDELDKACQTSVVEEPAGLGPDDAFAAKKEISVSTDTQTDAHPDLPADECFDTQMDLDKKPTDLYVEPSPAAQMMGVPMSNGVAVASENVTFLEIDSLNFILPHDFVQSGQSVISKVEDFECISESGRERTQVLMNIGLPKTNIELTNLEKKEGIDKLEESVSQHSLNIHADERMPPRGELSEQESNGASDIAWGGTYQEGSSGMSTSYDLLARESWEASDCSDSEIPPLQSRVPPSGCYSPELDTDAVMATGKKVDPLSFSCATCGETFNCPKERRVHQSQEHSPAIEVKKEENNFEIFAKTEPDMDSVALGEVHGEQPDATLDTKPAIAKESVLCNVCGELLGTMKELSAHLKNVHKIWSGQRHQCKTCFEEFPSDTKYTEHLRVHPLECSMCAKVFYRRVNFQMHMKRHWGVRPYKCDVCSKAFLTKQKLTEHQNVHTGNAPLKCGMCDETFRRHSNLVQHRNRHHYNIKKKVKDYVCHCGEVFHSVNKFTWHKETHEARPKSCTYCQEKFVHMSSLTRHIRRAHNQRYVPEERRDNENVECHVCKGVYLRSSLEMHLLTHSTARQHSCLICGKEFTTKWNLKLHRWTHASRTSKPFKCDLCNGAFIRHSDYVAHMNSHKRVRPYTCNYCGCKFIRKYNCQRHVREHEEGKSYTCTICGKSFHRSYYLKEHMRVHSGARPFACHICGKTSTTKSNHNKHMKIHHAREPVSTEG